MNHSKYCGPGLRFNMFFVYAILISLRVSASDSYTEFNPYIDCLNNTDENDEQFSLFDINLMNENEQDISKKEPEIIKQSITSKPKKRSKRKRSEIEIESQQSQTRSKNNDGNISNNQIISNDINQNLTSTNMPFSLSNFNFLFDKIPRATGTFVDIAVDGKDWPGFKKIYINVKLGDHLALTGALDIDSQGEQKYIIKFQVPNISEGFHPLNIGNDQIGYITIGYLEVNNLKNQNQQSFDPFSNKISPSFSIFSFTFDINVCRNRFNKFEFIRISVNDSNWPGFDKIDIKVLWGPVIAPIIKMEHNLIIAQILPLFEPCILKIGNENIGVKVLGILNVWQKNNKKYCSFHKTPPCN